MAVMGKVKMRNNQFIAEHRGGLLSKEKHFQLMHRPSILPEP